MVRCECAKACSRQELSRCRVPPVAPFWQENCSFAAVPFQVATDGEVTVARVTRTAPPSISWTDLAGPAIILLAFALRVFRIGAESVGHDEAFTLTAVRLPLHEMMRLLASDYVHPPLHYVVLRGWLDMWGFGVVQARWLSALFGTASVLMIQLLGNRLFGRRTALLASLLLAISQIGIMFSQEGRPYAQFLFLFLSSCYLFVAALEHGHRRTWCALLASSILTVYTHYYGVFVILSFVVFCLIWGNSQAASRMKLIGVAMLSIASLVPWLLAAAPHAVHDARLESGRLPWWQVHWWTPISAINSFNNGKPHGLLGASPAWTFILGGLLFAVPAVFALTLLMNRSRNPQAAGVGFSLVLFLLPLIIVVVVGLAGIQYNVRYVAFCAAPYYLLVGVGLAKLPTTWLRIAVTVLIVVYTGFSLRSNYFMHWKEDFRHAVAYVHAQQQADDCGIFFPRATVSQWSIASGAAPALKATSADSILAARKQCTRIWYITATFDGNAGVSRISSTEKGKLSPNYARISSRRFFWVDVDLYELAGNK